MSSVISFPCRYLTLIQHGLIPEAAEPRVKLREAVQRLRQGLRTGWVEIANPGQNASDLPKTQPATTTKRA